MDRIDLVQDGQVAGCCKHANEHLCDCMGLQLLYNNLRNYVFCNLNLRCVKHYRIVLNCFYKQKFYRCGITVLLVKNLDNLCLKSSLSLSLSLDIYIYSTVMPHL